MAEGEWSSRDLEQFREAALHLAQPLLDHGWRVDYDRLGIGSPGGFLSLAQMREALDVLGPDVGPPAGGRPPGSLLREGTPEEREEWASRPLEDLLDADALAAVLRGQIAEEHVRQAIREGLVGPKCHALIPGEGLQAAVEALDYRMGGELWRALAEFRRAHRGAAFEQCREELLRADARLRGWTLSRGEEGKVIWRHYWRRLEAAQPLT
jgi:hypothetical protein